jgi:hypothetical protein
VQVIDSANCKLPDYYIHKAPTCACGDDPVQISDKRRKEGLAQHAHWCTGTLQMQDGFGNMMHVYNPFTYDQLKKLAAPGSIDRYLRCVSQLQYGSKSGEFKNIQCDTIRPDYEGFRKAGTSLIAVIERCKANFQQKQWDVGAYLAFDAKAMQKIGAGAALPLSDGVGDCLLKAHASRQSNEACMSGYLLRTYRDEANAAVFWRYAKSHTTLSGGSDDVDACIVFSGPAKMGNTTLTGRAFQNCSHDYNSGSNCMIPRMVKAITLMPACVLFLLIFFCTCFYAQVWSSNSKNKVPVAMMHSVDEQSEVDRRENAMALFQEAYQLAMSSLNKLKDFKDKNLEVVLFSGWYFCPLVHLVLVGIFLSFVFSWSRGGRFHSPDLRLHGDGAILQGGLLGQGCCQGP